MSLSRIGSQFTKLFKYSEKLTTISGIQRNSQCTVQSRNFCNRQSVLFPIAFLQGKNLYSTFSEKVTAANIVNNMHSEQTILDSQTFRVVTIPATQDNFMYLIVDKSSMQAFVVDPVEPETVLSVVRKQNVTLSGILTTHHHWDHAGGNEKMVNMYKSENGDNTAKMEVYGGDDRIGALTKKVGQGDQIQLGTLTVDCLFTPCHTTGHICYFVKPTDSANEEPAVFTGDTLFIAGCGRFFEGTPQEMYSALVEKLGQLPPKTRVFCGHEYTVNNLKFALSVEPNNAAAKEKLSWAENQRSNRLPTVPSTIAEEKDINPFMRVILPQMQQQVGASDSVGCMRILRTMKDNF